MQKYKELSEFAKSRLRADFANANDADEQVAVIEQAMALGLPELVAELEDDLNENDPERSSIFSDRELVEQKLRRSLPAAARDVPLRIDIARHIFRPHTSGPASGQNFLFDSAHQRVRPLQANQLFQRLPVSNRICRVYAHNNEYAGELAQALDGLIGGAALDDLTNM